MSSEGQQDILKSRSFWYTFWYKYSKTNANGVDSREIKKAQKASREESNANSFEVVAREWHNKFKGSWSESHAHVVLNRLERNIFPWIGSRPIAELEPPEVLSVLLRMEERGA